MGLTRPRAYQIYDIDYKQAVRVVTTTNITLGGSAPNNVDGVTLSLNDRVLVTGQSTGSQNGIYYVSTLGTGSNGTWTRSTDTDVTGELLSGTIVMVTEGNVYKDTQWKLTTDDPITIGVTSLTFVQNYSANSISSGTSNVSVQANSNVSIAVAGSNTVVYSAGTENITANIIPTANVTYNLGNATNRFKDLYLSNSSIYLGNLTLAGNATELTVNGATVVTASGSSTLSLTGNITGGNLISNGLITATGNINSNGAVNINSSSGMYNVLNITGTALAPYGSSQTWKFFTQNAVPGGPGSWILFPDSSLQTTAYPGSSTALSLSANITGGNLISNAQVTASGNVTGGNVLTGGIISATGNATVGNITATIGTFTTFTSAQGGTITGTLVATSANAQFFNQTNGAGYITVAGYLSAVGNITGGNLITAGLLTATGNITGGNLRTAGLASVTGNITGGNITTAGQVTATANITGGNLLTVGQISSTGTITTAAGTNSTGFAVGNGAVSNVGLGFFPTAGTRGDYAIRDYSSVFSTMYLDVGMGGSAGGEFQFRTGNTYSLSMRANSSGVYSSGVVSATGIVYGSELNATNSQVNEGGQINLALPSSGSTLSTSVIIDVYQNRLRFFEGGGTARGAYIDLTSCSAGAATNLLAGGGGTPGGSNTYVQFNDSGTFGGNGQFTYDKVTNTLTAGIIAANNNGTGQNFKVGDDIWIGDINLADTMRLTGQQNGANAYIVFGNADGAQLGRAGTGPLTYAGAFSATGNITGGNLSGTSIVGTLTTSAQTNITSVGTLGSLAVTGNVTGGNFIGTLNGSGANVTSISATNISSGTLAQARLANASIIIGNTTSTLGATVTTITGLTSVTSTTFVGALTGAATSATTAGTVTTAAQPNITSVGTLTSLAVTGNTTSGNFVGTLNGSGANVTSISATNISSGTLAQARLANSAVTLGSTALTLGSTVTTVAGLTSVTSTTFVGSLSGAATTAGTVTTAAQPNITSTGTLSSLSVTGNITSSTGHVGTIYTNSIINTGANATGNIGSSTLYFNTAFVKATSAQYADLAEIYVADANYDPGTLVEFGGNFEITQTTNACSTAIAGIISTNPSYLMNSCQPGEYVLPVALTGRVPCQVLGPVKKGDVLISSNIPGVAQRIGANWQPGCTVGKAMESITESVIKTIEVAVGRL